MTNFGCCRLYLFTQLSAFLISIYHSRYGNIIFLYRYVFRKDTYMHIVVHVLSDYHDFDKKTHCEMATVTNGN